MARWVPQHEFWAGWMRVYRGLMPMQDAGVRSIGYDYELGHEDVPVRGNLIASGDEERDREDEAAVIERLERGDVSAWCVVTAFAYREVFPLTPIGWDLGLPERVSAMTWWPQGEAVLGGMSFLEGDTHGDHEDLIRAEGLFDRAREDLEAQEQIARRYEVWFNPESAHLRFASPRMSEGIVLVALKTMRQVGRSMRDRKTPPLNLHLIDMVRIRVAMDAVLWGDEPAARRLWEWGQNEP